MRFNKQELITLAALPSNKFEKEGILNIIEKQEGFFTKREGNFQALICILCSLFPFLSNYVSHRNNTKVFCEACN